MQQAQQQQQRDPDDDDDDDVEKTSWAYKKMNCSDDSPHYERQQ